MGRNKSKVWQLDAEGRQPHLSSRFTPDELLKKLKTGATKEWEKKFTAEIRESCGGMCVLVCKDCNACLSSSNPSQLLKTHIESCKGSQKGKPNGMHAAATAVVVLEDSDDDVEDKPSPSKRRRTGTITGYMATKEQITQAHNHLLRFLITTNTAFRRVNNEHLRKFAAVFGVDLLDESAFRTRLLIAEYELVQAAVGKEISTLMVSKYVMIVSDGWKKKAAGRGTPLVNIVLLKPDGGVIFYKVLDTAGEKKDAAWIAQTHIKVANELVAKFGGTEDSIGGFIMDNPKANRAALIKLEKHNSKWIGMGCSAHALNLLCKDLADDKACPGVAKVLRTVQTIALVLGDSATIRKALEEQQCRVYGEVRAIPSHCPTRWGILCMIVAALLHSKEALREMVESSSWDEVSKGSSNAAALKELKSGDWWANN